MSPHSPVITNDRNPSKSSDDLDSLDVVFAEADGSESDDTSASPSNSTPASEVINQSNLAEETYFSFESLPPFPHLLRHPLKAAYWIFDVMFGIVSLFALLAFLAAIPIVNVLALGYLLEAEGRVARTGKLRYAMPMLPLASQLGGIAFGTWVWFRFVQLVADAASDAELIAPGSGVAIGWRVAVTIFAIGVAIHLILAIARGGRLGLFFWPTPLNALWLWRQLQRGDYTKMAGIAVRDFVTALKLRHHFSLGFRGFIGAFAWLLLPTALFSALRDTSKPGQVLVTLFGGLLLIFVFGWVPFLQARFAAENRIGAFFELRKIRGMWKRTPILFLLSTVVMFAFALPLYLFKIFEVPQDMRWMLTPIFVVTIYPARIFVGWVYSWAVYKQRKTWFLVRLACTVLVLPALAFYTFLLFFTPAVGAAGRAVLFQHHAILLPWPF